MAIVFVLGTVAFTIYGQLIIKHRIDQSGAVPDGVGQFWHLTRVALSDPILLSGFVAGAAASLLWMAALARLDLSYAYPFMALSFVGVLALSSVLLGETVGPSRIIGVALIVLGVLSVAAGS